MQKKGDVKKEKAMPVRLEHGGILVVSQESGKPHEQTYTGRGTNARLFSSSASSHLYGVSIVFPTARAHSHTHTRVRAHSEETLSDPMVRANERPLLTYGHRRSAALQAELESPVEGTMAPHKNAVVHRLCTHTHTHSV